MDRKRKVSYRRMFSLFTIIMGLVYVVIASNLMSQAICIVAAVDKGLVPELALVLSIASGLAWFAGRLGR